VSTTRKYRTDNLMPVLRIFVKARNAAVAVGFTDNGGAIHSVERILNILGMRIRYPHLTHSNSLKTDQRAEISVAAHEARLRGEAINIEHVLPQRAFALLVIGMVTNGATDEAILQFIKDNYRLVLLSKVETATLNRANRSRISPDRLAGIPMWKPVNLR
jgi:hypothetical protein